MRRCQGRYAVTLVIFAQILAGSAEAKHAVVAGPRCWTVPQITAAKINELSVLLNVQSLRCRVADTTILDQYDAFTKASRSTMRGVAATVKGHFGGSASLYDRYAISLANKYGAGVKGESCENVATLMQAATAAGGTAPALSQVGETANIDPTILGGACPLHPLKPFVGKKIKLRARHRQG